MCPAKDGPLLHKYDNSVYALKHKYHKRGSQCFAPNIHQWRKTIANARMTGKKLPVYHVRYLGVGPATVASKFLVEERPPPP